MNSSPNLPSKPPKPDLSAPVRPQSLASTADTPVPPPAPEDETALQAPKPPKPPQRPIEPASTASTPAPAAAHPISTTSSSQPVEDATASSPLGMRQQPIPAPSEPMQYRAIGLIRGRYVESEEQFTRGTLVTPDGTEINAVLLGRIMSLVKKHLDLGQDHLWVVYPRTREKEADLHAQIVGVWEPENLHKDISPDGESEAATPPALAMDDGYFSIRGEVVYYAAEGEHVTVKIRQSPRKDDDEGKAFKLQLQGTLTGKTVGYFWDFQVQRQGQTLVIQQGTMIGMLPPQKRSAQQRDKRKPFGSRRPREDNRPPRPRFGGQAEQTVPPRKTALPKPVKRKNNNETPS